MSLLPHLEAQVRAGHRDYGDPLPLERIYERDDPRRPDPDGLLAYTCPTCATTLATCRPGRRCCPDCTGHVLRSAP